VGAPLDLGIEVVGTAATALEELADVALSSVSARSATLAPRLRRPLTFRENDAPVTTLHMDPARIDDAVRGLQDEDIPRWKEIDGFKGFTLLADRQSGKVAGTSHRESEQAIDASEEAVTPSRERREDGRRLGAAER
jgi:hypothetical protein